MKFKSQNKNSIRVRKALLFLLGLILLFSRHTVFSQQDFKFEHIGYEEGLPDAFHILFIVQDHTGFIWLAGRNTLVQYNGYNTKVYDIKNIDSTLPPGWNGIRSMLVDRDNHLWIITGFGLSKYQRDSDNFTNYHIFSEPNVQYSHPNIRGGEDKSGLLWISTYYNGLYSFNKVTGEVGIYKHEEGNSNSLISDSLFSSAIDDYNNIWISAYPPAKGLEKFDIDKKTITHYKHSAIDSTTIASDNVGMLYKDKSGKIWIGLDSNRFDELNPVYAKFEHYRLDIDFFISSFYQDASGLLWIAQGFGSKDIIRFDKNKLQYSIIRNDPLNPQSISIGSMAIYGRNSDVFWIGSWQNDLCKIVSQKHVFKYSINALNTARVRSITGDSSSNIWAGKINGLDKFDPLKGEYTHYAFGNLKQRITSQDEINSLYVDNEGIVWAGTNGRGLIKFNIKTGKLAHFENNRFDTNSISGHFINDIFEDSFGNLWIGTEKGPNIFDRKKYTFRNFKNSQCDSEILGSFTVTSIYEDRNATIWFGSDSYSKGGLYRYNRSSGTFNRFYDEKTIGLIMGICEDSKERFWLCGGQGVIFFDRNSGKAKPYYKNFGFPANYANNILADNLGRIWISTHIGLSCFDPNTETFRNFDKDDGLKVTDFFLNASYKGKDGKMYFGGEGGMMIFNPDSVNKNTNIPNIVFTDFKIFNQSVIPSANSPLKKHINVAEDINLSYGDNSFSFEFAALDFNNPGRNQYAYMMEGFDNDWFYSGTSRTAFYTNLDPGEYTFRVKGSNNDGVWNEKGTSIKVIITPPWWKTWWFRGCGVILILGILGYTRQRQLSKIRREIKQKEEFARQLIDSQEQERKRIAGDLHDSLAQNLLVTKNRVSLLERKKNIDNEIKSELIGINEGILGSLSEIRTISYSLRPHEIERFGLTDSIRQLIEKIKESGGIDFKIQLDNIDKLLKQGDEVILYRIIQECLNNILKHSAAKTSEIHISKLPETIQIIIKDDGKGFDIEIITDQAKGNFGLKGLKERVNLLKGTFNIITFAKKGTIIQINIPAKVNSY